MIFIDGQNLLYGAKNFDSNFRFDIDKLVDYLKNLKKDRELIEVFYYSSIRPPRHNDVNDTERYKKQQRFYEKLKYKYRVTIKKLKLKEEKCPKCNQTFLVWKEKGIDVALATDLLLYGLTNEFDVAIVVSGDSDLAPVIRKLRDRKPSIRIEIAQFKRMVGAELKQVCHDFYELDKASHEFKLVE